MRKLYSWKDHNNIITSNSFLICLNISAFLHSKLTHTIHLNSVYLQYTTQHTNISVLKNEKKENQQPFFSNVATGFFLILNLTCDILRLLVVDTSKEFQGTLKDFH